MDYMNSRVLGDTREDRIRTYSHWSNARCQEVMLSNGITMDSMTYEQRIRLRHKYSLGGHAIAAVLGVDKYRNILNIYDEMTDSVISDDEPNFAMRTGLAMERTIAEEFGRVMHTKVEEGIEAVMLTQAPWHSVQIDALLPELHTHLEIKVGFSNPMTDDGYAWGRGCDINSHGEVLVEDDLIPINYMFQCQTQMMCMKETHMYLACWLTSSQSIRIFHITENKELQKRILDAGERFMFSNVIPQIRPTHEEACLPAPIGTAPVLAKQRLTEAQVEQLSSLCAEYKEKSREAKDINQELSAVKRGIQAFFGEDTEALTDSNGHVLTTYKFSTRRSLDTDYIKDNYPEVYKDTEAWKSTTSRTLLVK